MDRDVIPAAAIKQGQGNRSRDGYDQHPEYLHPKEFRLAGVGNITQRSSNVEDVSGPFCYLPHGPQRPKPAKGNRRYKEQTSGDLGRETEKAQVQEKEPEGNKGEWFPALFVQQRLFATKSI